HRRSESSDSFGRAWKVQSVVDRRRPASFVSDSKTEARTPKRLGGMSRRRPGSPVSHTAPRTLRLAFVSRRKTATASHRVAANRFVFRHDAKALALFRLDPDRLSTCPPAY